eukprot:TRINITY_DN35908_c0_g1_i1.p1 TRINITY_DN35908_c0_g1~~TRINITY_DN35908_c0_g1_i1.p1  ORF type:complete len:1098 (+),score=200.23 TRINITY_DN35908_c0_g1_i1:67-3294(+)
MAVCAEDGVEALTLAADTGFALYCAIFVFCMQTGFCFLEAGNVRAVNVQNIVLKNLGDCCIGAICWWMAGFGLAYGADAGEADNPFLGNADFFLLTGGAVSPCKFGLWMKSYAYLTTASTIVSGAVAERISLRAYYCIVFVICTFTYPIGLHWVWSPQGWLSPWKGEVLMANGALDFAGGGVIHLTGGVGATIAAVMVGPRSLPCGVDVFSAEGAALVSPHNRFSAAIGALFLWVSWFAFNASGVASLSADGGSSIASNACFTTLVSGSTAIVTSAVYTRITLGHTDMLHACNSLLAGLVGITAGCGFISPHWSIVVGFASCFFFVAWSNLRVKLRIDDVIDAGAVHGVCGAWGILAVGLFCDADRVRLAIGVVGAGSAHGVFNGGGFEQLGVQALALASLAAWSAACMGLTCIVLKLTIGLRVSEHAEHIGLDIAELGTSSYDYLDRIREEAEAAERIQTMAGSAFDCLIEFDLDAARSIVQESIPDCGAAPPFHKILLRLLNNLGSYRPYLPDALFCAQDSDDDDATEETTASPRLAFSPSTDGFAQLSAGFPQGPVACIAFSDVEASTKLWEHAGDSMREALGLHNSLLRKVIDDTGGYEVKIIGDAFMVAYESPEDAVRFGLDAQCALVGCNQWPELLLEHPLCTPTDDKLGRRIWNGVRIRVGIHVGEVRVELNPVNKRADYFGNTVNRAARCESSSVGGMVCITSSVMQEVRGTSVLAGAVIYEMGMCTLKGVAGKVELTGLFPASLSARQERATQVLAERAECATAVSGPRSSGAHRFSTASSRRRGSEVPDAVELAVCRLQHRLNRKKGSLLRVQVQYRELFPSEVTHGEEVLATIQAIIALAADTANKHVGKLASVVEGSLEVTFNVTKPNKDHLNNALLATLALRSAFESEPRVAGFATAGVSTGDFLSGNAGGLRNSFSLVVSSGVEGAALACAVAARYRTFAVLATRITGNHPEVSAVALRPVREIAEAGLYFEEFDYLAVSVQETWRTTYADAFDSGDLDTLRELSARNSCDVVLARVVSTLHGADEDHEFDCVENSIAVATRKVDQSEATSVRPSISELEG